MLHMLCAISRQASLICAAFVGHKSIMKKQSHIRQLLTLAYYLTKACFQQGPTPR